MATIRQKAFPPGVYRGVPYTRDLLREFVEGTNKAIALGIPVPLLNAHAPKDCDDKTTQQFAGTDGKGWVTKLEQDESDGAVIVHGDNVSDDTAKEINEGRVRFTSPEFRRKYKSDDGRFEGKIARHFAFTPKPANTQQGKIEVLTQALDEGTVQLSEADYEGPVEGSEQHAEHPGYSEDHESVKTLNGHGWKDTGKIVGTGPHDTQRTYVHPSHGVIDHFSNGSFSHYNEGKLQREGVSHGELKKYLGEIHGTAQHSEGDEIPKKEEPPVDTENTPPEPEKNAANPDMPPKATDRSKLAAFVSGMAQLGVVLPSDFDLADDSALDLLITGINTQCKAKADAESEPEEPKEPTDTEANPTWAFSEQELAALPPKAKAAYEFAIAAKKREQEQAAQFAEQQRSLAAEKAELARTQAVQSIRSLKMLPGLKAKLLGMLEPNVAQFTEAGEQPTLTVQKVAELIAASIPPSMAFEEGDAKEEAHPDGDQFFEHDKSSGKPQTPEQAKKLIEQIDKDMGFKPKRKPVAA